MKMIRALVRLEKEEEVTQALQKNGFTALTKMDVIGRGKQGGIQIGNTSYQEIAKCMLLVVVEDEKVQQAVQTILHAAQTGNFGDGKVFVSPVESTYTIRTGKPGL